MQPWRGSQEMLETFLQILFMLLAANAAPILAARVFRSHADLALDLGWRLSDGQPVFGSSKTWRGFFAALSAACIVSILFGHGPWFGLKFGTLVMIGDLLSSFIKRRRGIAPSDQSLGLDQLPESLLPSVYALSALGQPWWWAIPLTVSFLLIELFISRPLFLLKIRKRPY